MTPPLVLNTTRPMLDRRIRWRRVLIYVGVTLFCFFLAGTHDYELYHQFKPIDTGEQDWHRMLRVLGYVPLWGAAALAMACLDFRLIRVQGFTLAMARPILLLLAVLSTAALVEPIKIITRRVRPDLSHGEWMWRSWLDRPFDAGGLCTPSSHAAIAFAACFMLCKLHPRATPVWIALAIGCGVTRVINHAHFLSDIVISAALALAVVDMWWNQHRRTLARLQPPAATQASPADAIPGGD
jgi:membrane-associated phospholipid phosphatase